MKLALVGYGKMGRAVENMAMERGHEVVAKIDPTLGSHAIGAETLGGADVAIEFTAPDVAVENITALATAGVDAVVGGEALIAFGMGVIGLNLGVALAAL